MALDRAHAEDKLLGDLLVAQASGQEAQYFHLTWGQPGRAGCGIGAGGWDGTDFSQQRRRASGLPGSAKALERLLRGRGLWRADGIPAERSQHPGELDSNAGSFERRWTAFEEVAGILLQAACTGEVARGGGRKPGGEARGGAQRNCAHALCEGLEVSGSGSRAPRSPSATGAQTRSSRPGLRSARCWSEIGRRYRSARSAAEVASPLVKGDRGATKQGTRVWLCPTQERLRFVEAALAAAEFPRERQPSARIIGHGRLKHAGSGKQLSFRLRPGATPEQ